MVDHSCSCCQITSSDTNQSLAVSARSWSSASCSFMLFTSSSCWLAKSKAVCSGQLKKIITTKATNLHQRMDSRWPSHFRRFRALAPSMRMSHMAVSDWSSTFVTVSSAKMKNQMCACVAAPTMRLLEATPKTRMKMKIFSTSHKLTKTIWKRLHPT